MERPKIINVMTGDEPSEGHEPSWLQHIHWGSIHARQIREYVDYLEAQVEQLGTERDMSPEEAAARDALVEAAISWRHSPLSTTHEIHLAVDALEEKRLPNEVLALEELFIENRGSEYRRIAELVVEQFVVTPKEQPR